MTTVPWIPLYTSWPRHRKTMALRRILGTAEPIIGLWCWAAENAPDGDLSGLPDEDLENVSGWTGERGKAISAMVEVGFIDKVSDNVSANRYVLHEWMDGAGAKVASYLERNRRQREIMRERRSGSEDQSKKKSKKKSVSVTLALTDEPTLLSFPCDGEPDTWSLVQSMVTKWSSLYPHLDIMAECRKALGWIDANPTERKTHQGMKRFLVGWFGRSQNRGGGGQRGSTQPVLRWATPHVD
jgi:hypothetical protein